MRYNEYTDHDGIGILTNWFSYGLTCFSGAKPGIDNVVDSVLNPNDWITTLVVTHTSNVITSVADSIMTPNVEQLVISLKEKIKEALGLSNNNQKLKLVGSRPII